MSDALREAFRVARRLPLHLQQELAARIIVDVCETEEREALPYAVDEAIRELTGYRMEIGR
jgi:hypothetical protein